MQLTTYRLLMAPFNTDRPDATFRTTSPNPSGGR
jgi:hypothetical protein